MKKQRWIDFKAKDYSFKLWVENIWNNLSDQISDSLLNDKKFIKHLKKLWKKRKPYGKYTTEKVIAELHEYYL